MSSSDKISCDVKCIIIVTDRKDIEQYAIDGYDIKFFHSISQIDYFPQSPCLVGIDLDYFSINEVEQIKEKLRKSLFSYSIIYFISNANEEILEYCYKKPNLGVLRKPVIKVEMSGIIKNYFSLPNIDYDTSDISSIENKFSLKEFYKIEMEFSPLGMLIELGSKVLFSNQKLSDILGLTNDEIKKFNFWNKLSDIEFKTSTFNENHQRFSAKIETGDGYKIFIDVDEILTNYYGKKIKLYMIQDVSEFKIAENQLVEQQKYLETLLQSLPVGILVSNQQSRVIFDINSTFLEMSEYSISELMGKKFNSLISIDDEEAIFTVPTCETLITKSNSKLPIEILQFVLEINDETQIVTIVIDNTAKKLAEKSIAAKERLQGVLELAGTINHELNQPLQVLLGNCDLLLMFTPENDKNYKYIKKIEENVNKMADITKKINDITQYKTEDYVGEKRIINLNEAIKK